jgi:putative ABC transport system permease protein
MSWTRFFRRRYWDQERARELDAYLGAETDENVARGMSPEEARYAAHRKLGNTTLIGEDIYCMNSFGWIETLWQDVHYGFRVLRKNPGFTAVVVFTLALGIGATTAIFTVVNAVLLRPLPYPHPEELVYVQEILGQFGVQAFVWNTEYAAWRERSQTLNPVAAYMNTWFNLTGGADPERVVSGLATSSFFNLLGARPIVGRLFLPEEERPGSPPVVILSEALWRRRYGGDPSIVGKEITLDGTAYSVVGVLPASFVIPDRWQSNYALWVPLDASDRRNLVIRVVGRLKPGVSLAAARTELDTIMQSRLGKGLTKSVVLSRWQEEITEKFRLSLVLFLGATGFLLLIACVNVANLMFSRASARDKEIAVRLAMGAGRKRIVRQLLTESSLMACLSGLLGLGLARWGKDLLVSFISVNLPSLEPVGLDYRVLGFCLALAMLTGLAFGVVPALQASRISLNEVLKEASRTTSEVRSGKVFRNLLIVAETALAMVLLVGAGLLFRSFLRVRGIDPGFKPGNILCVSIDLTLSKYPTPKAQATFFEQVIERIKGPAGVQSVGASSCPPLGKRASSVSGLEIEGRLGVQTSIPFANISPDYFRTMGIPLKQGRYFDDGDRDGSMSVAIVNESFARRYFPNEICLGRRLSNFVQKEGWLTIVGVVGDAQRWAEEQPGPEIYLPYLQAAVPYMTLLVRTGANPKHWAAGVRTQIANVDKEQPPHNVTTMDELQAASLTPRRVNLLLFEAFAALGLILTLVGIYGVVSYSVSQRTHEIGVRIALGARRGDVLKSVVGQGFRLTLAGVGIGIIGALAVTRFMSSLLYGVTPTDPVTFLAVSLIVVGVALLASYTPARRATKVDPMVALKYE